MIKKTKNSVQKTRFCWIILPIVSSSLILMLTKLNRWNKMKVWNIIVMWI